MAEMERSYDTMLRQLPSETEVAELLVDGVENARALTLGDNGTLFVSTRRAGRVYAVRGAFTVGEARALARRAGLAGVMIERVWPQRFVLRWRRA